MTDPSFPAVRSWSMALLFGVLIGAAGGVVSGSEDRTAPTPADRTAPAPADSITPVPSRGQDGLVAVNGTELFVERVGAGEPIVIVHGGPVLEHGYLLPHLTPLADDYELVFFDQRLSGRSAPSVDADSVRLATFVDDIEALRVALGLGRIHLMGHSWGGLLAMRYALSYPPNLRSLLLISSMAASGDLWRQEEAVLGERITEQDNQERAAIRASEAFAARRPQAIAQLLMLSFRPQFHDPRKLAELHLYVPDDYVERSRQFGALAPELESFDLHDGLESLDVPTLILYGDDEPGGPLGGAAIHERIAGSRYVTIEKAGHFAFIEQPAAFLSAVRGFLAERAR